jgi:hypothetical protein
MVLPSLADDDRCDGGGSQRYPSDVTAAMIESYRRRQASR